MNFTVDKEYQINEVFRHEQTGKMLQVRAYDTHAMCCGCPGFSVNCSGGRCRAYQRNDKLSVVYKEVTEPKEGMLYRVEGKLFELVNCPHLSAVESAIDIAVFNRVLPGWRWKYVEEKEAEAPKAEPTPYMRHLAISKAFIDENKATFKIAEQSHRTAAFTPNGNTFTAGNGVKIMSCNSPAIRVPEDGHLFVCGGLWRCDNDELTCSIEFFNKIKEAVKEYNETDGVGYANCIPKREAPMKKEESIVKRWIKLGPPRYEGNNVYFCIVEQSHVWEEFVPGGKHTYTASNGYILMSVTVPDADVFLMWCYVRGDDKCDDYNVLSMTKDEYDKFVFAVEEYNTTNGCGLPKKVEKFPIESDKYFFVDNNGTVDSTRYVAVCTSDVQRKELGNCFKTGALAERAAKEIKRCLKEFNEN